MNDWLGKRISKAAARAKGRKKKTTRILRLRVRGKTVYMDKTNGVCLTASGKKVRHGNIVDKRSKA